MVHLLDTFITALQTGRCVMMGSVKASSTPGKASQGSGSSADTVAASLNQVWASKPPAKSHNRKPRWENALCWLRRHHQRRQQRENLLSHAVAKHSSWHLTPERRARWAPRTRSGKHHFMLPCLSPLGSHTRGYSSSQHTAARLFAQVIDEKFILFLRVFKHSVRECHWLPGSRLSSGSATRSLWGSGWKFQLSPVVK